MVVQPYEVGNCLTARMAKGINSTLDEGQTPVIALQDVRPVEKAQNGKGWNDDGTAYTVDTHATQGVALPVGIFQDSEFGVAQYDSAGTLRAGRIPEHQMVMQPISIHPHCIGRAPEAGPQGKEYLLDGSAYCMDSRGQPQAVAQPVGVDIFNAAFSGDVAVPLTNRADGTGTGPTVMQQMAVRRLTPVECERLQGFPDNYTNIPWTEYQRIQKQAAKAGTSFEAELKKRGKVLHTTVNECPDGPRYKALGNSWAVPNVRWIGQRIQKALNDL